MEKAIIAELLAKLAKLEGPGVEQVYKFGKQKLDSTRPTTHVVTVINDLPVVVYSNLPDVTISAASELGRAQLLGVGDSFQHASAHHFVSRDCKLQIMEKMHTTACLSEFVASRYTPETLPKVMGESRIGDNFVVLIACPTTNKAVINGAIATVQWELVRAKLREIAEEMVLEGHQSGHQSGGFKRLAATSR